MWIILVTFSLAQILMISIAWKRWGQGYEQGYKDGAREAYKWLVDEGFTIMAPEMIEEWEEQTDQKNDQTHEEL